MYLAEKLIPDTMKAGTLFLSISLMTLTSCAELMNVIQSPVALPLTEEEVASGLREALSIGAKNSADRLAVENGYYGDLAVRILLPDEA